MLSAILKKDLKKVNSTILIPKNIFPKVPHNILKMYDNSYPYESYLKNLFSIKAIINTLKLINLCKYIKKKKFFESIFFGAYRDTVTSIVTKQFRGESNFIAIKQGVEMPKSKFKYYFSLNDLHNKIYFSLFGYSAFKNERLVINNCSFKNNNLLSRHVWEKDPFHIKNIYTIGSKNKNIDDRHPFVYPNLSNLKNDSKIKSISENILIIGERTPISPSWSIKDTNKFSKLVILIRKQFNNPKFFLRPRAGLTNNDFYKFLDPIFLDPYQLFDDQLVKLNPSLVISIKSTASKVAGYYGYNSIILFRCFNFKKSELFHLNHLFADNSPIQFINNFEDIKSIKKSFKQVNNLEKFQSLTFKKYLN